MQLNNLVTGDLKINIGHLHDTGSSLKSSCWRRR